jgi:hypothetical protein
LLKHFFYKVFCVAPAVFYVFFSEEPKFLLFLTLFAGTGGHMSGCFGASCGVVSPLSYGDKTGMNHENVRLPDTWMFHESEAPKGRVFQAADVPQLRRKGWVDTPAKFGKGIRSRYRRKLQAVRTFWSIVFSRN